MNDLEKRIRAVIDEMRDVSIRDVADTLGAIADEFADLADDADAEKTGT